MSGVIQATFMNQRSFVIPLPAIGDAYQGGFFAGQISTTANSIATHNLIVGPVSSAQSSSKQWKTANTSTSGTSSEIDGPTNSSNMNNASHPAAEFCEGLSIGGFSDWYMPAINELEVCYYNLKPTTTNNSASAQSGTNDNAVPSQSGAYSSGTPAQTSATNFKDTGTEDFDAAFYWSSTEYYSTKGWFKSFSNGFETFGYKNNSYRVRAIRRVAV